MTVALLQPWNSLSRARFRLDLWARQLSIHTSTASFQISPETPAMEALKKLPYPSTPVDLNTFEDAAEEYTATNFTTARHLRCELAKHLPKTSNQVLVHLIRNQQVNDAERVRAELQDMGTVIEPHLVYAEAAISILEGPKPEERVAAFAQWLSLVPDASGGRPRILRRISRLLLQSPIPSLPLITTFMLICAGKGYGRGVYSRIVPFVVRFTDPTISTRFIEEFERLILQHPLSRKPSKTVKHIHNLVITAHCHAGRLDEAVKLLSKDGQRKIRASEKVFNIVMRELEWKNDPGLTSIVRHLLDHRRRRSTALPSGNPPMVQSLVQTMEQNDKSDPDSGLVSTGERAVEIPHVESVSKDSHTQVFQWLLSELTKRRQERDHAGLLQLFIRYFYFIGLPRQEIMQFIQTSPGTNEIGLPSRLPLSAYHLNHIWDTLVSLSTGPEQLEALYKVFLGSKRPQDTSTHASGLLTPPALAMNATCFTPFIRAFSYSCGPDRAVAVLNSMQELGIHPTSDTYTELAGAYARAGEVEKTMVVLGYMDASNSEPGNNMIRRFPPSTIVTYTSVMRGFVDAGCLDAALSIREQLIRKFNYTIGDNPKTDNVFSMLVEKTST